MPDPNAKRILWYLFAGSRGGINRARIVDLLKEHPYNMNQMAETLMLDYKAIQHHISVLEKNNIVSKMGEKYGNGAAFAAAWTPCVGPILGSTFTLAATAPGAAYNSLLAYAMGLGIPFLITGAFFSQATGIIRRMVKYLKYFNPAMGALLIILGILVFTNQLSLLGNFPLANELINFERGI